MVYVPTIFDQELHNPSDDPGPEFEEKFLRVDLSEAWRLTKNDKDQPENFGPFVRAALADYFVGPRIPHLKLSLRDRRRGYDRLDKAAEGFLSEIDNAHWQIWYELHDPYFQNEPEDFDGFLDTENEGLTFGEFQIEELNQSVTRFREMLAEARESNDHVLKGRPKQNEGLDDLITRLGRLFQMATGDAPLKTYRYDVMQERREYQGPFFEFVFEIVWKFNGKTTPSNNSIGEVARRIFKGR